MHLSSSFAARLVAFACVEGIFFSSSFCAIFWLKKRNMCPGITFSNELISRDEGLHTDFACLLYSKIKQQLDESEVHSIVREAVEIECHFCSEALPVSLLGMNCDSMSQYVKFCADRLLRSLDCSPIWNVKTPLTGWSSFLLMGKSNFFEKRVGEYSLAGVGVDKAFQSFTLDEGIFLISKKNLFYIYS